MKAAALLLLIALVLVPASPARAHRLLADAMPCPFGLVQVESYFETKNFPHGARVRALDPQGKLVAEGVVDDKGIFVFAYAGTGPLHIVVEAGEGHRAEAEVSAADLVRCQISTHLAALTPSPSPFLAAVLWQPPGMTAPPTVESTPLTEHRTGIPIGGLILGVGILTGIAILSVIWRKVRGRRPLEEGSGPILPKSS